MYVHTVYIHTAYTYTFHHGTLPILDSCIDINTGVYTDVFLCQLMGRVDQVSSVILLNCCTVESNWVLKP